MFAMFAANTLLLLFSSYALNNMKNDENFGNISKQFLDVDVNLSMVDDESFGALNTKFRRETEELKVDVEGIDVIDDKEIGKNDRNVIVESKRSEKVKEQNETNAGRKKVPVKLNMKQGVMMNQILSVYALTNSKNPICANHSKEYQQAFRAFEPWALKMFDSSSKLQSGILAGNLMEYGSYKQCLGIFAATDTGEIRGKHCFIRIRPSMKIIRKILSYRNITEKRFENIKPFIKEASLYWSICIPNSCNHVDVLEHFNKTISGMTEGLDLKVSAEDLDCSSLDDEKAFSTTEWIVLSIILGYFGINLICTVIDVCQRKRNIARAKAVEIFSIYTNVIYVTNYKEEADRLSCLHGIRFISIILVLFGHKFLMSLFFPLVNTLDVLDWLTTYPSTFITGTPVSVDSFFLVSGLLLTYHFFEHISHGGKFNLFLFYCHRYLRLTPPLAVMVIIVSTFGERFGSGPLWKRVALVIIKPCQYFWWSTLAYIQCYTNTNYYCLLQTWYLSCDMQYYWFSPLILIPLWKWRLFGIFNLIFLISLSLAIKFILAWKHQFKITSLIDTNLTQTYYFVTYYVMPHIRVTPYFIGMGFGYFLQRTKDVKIKLHFLVVMLGWICSLATLLAVIMGNIRFQEEDYEYDRLEATMFMTFSRSAWVVGLAWIIWACRTGYGGPIDFLLSARIFQVLGRISYSIFLIHMEMQFFSGGATKTPIYFSGLNLTHHALGDLCLVLVMAFLLTVLVEYPCVRISLLFFKMGSTQIEPTANPEKLIRVRTRPANRN